MRRLILQYPREINDQASSDKLFFDLIKTCNILNARLNRGRVSVCKQLFSLSFRIYTSCVICKSLLKPSFTFFSVYLSDMFGPL